MSSAFFDSIPALRRHLAAVRRGGRTIGLVPTMGALHIGHIELIRRARRECDCVAVSIFVNPIQFDRKNDFEQYPRPMGADKEVCDRQGADLIFAPGAEEMYPQPQRSFVEVDALTEHLCGKFRPGHFRGVATVVAKLFQIVQPGRAYFGEKDAQQLAVIRRMVSDLNMPLEIVGVPTVREPDGLAVSSRNVHLDAQQRSVAPALYQALVAASEAVNRGEREAAAIRKAGMRILERQPAMRVEYFEVVDNEEMQPVERIAGSVRIAAAVWLGKTRLIDNVALDVASCPPNNPAAGHLH